VIRAGVIALVLAGPVGAEGLAGQALCAAVWAKVADGLAAFGDVSGKVRQDGDWCLVDAPKLTVALRAEPGIGLTRADGYAIGGMPQTVAEVALLFQGVTVNIGWTHSDAP
jgi:hypothetical protein